MSEYSYLAGAIINFNSVGEMVVAFVHEFVCTLLPIFGIESWMQYIGFSCCRMHSQLSCP